MSPSLSHQGCWDFLLLGDLGPPRFPFYLSPKENDMTILTRVRSLGPHIPIWAIDRDGLISKTSFILESPLWERNTSHRLVWRGASWSSASGVGNGEWSPSMWGANRGRSHTVHSSQASGISTDDLFNLLERRSVVEMSVSTFKSNQVGKRLNRKWEKPSIWQTEASLHGGDRQEKAAWEFWLGNSPQPQVFLKAEGY